MGDGIRWRETKRRKKRKREREEKRRERRRRKGERKRERKEKTDCSSSDLRRSDGQNSLDQEVKSVYSTRAMLQEVGIPLPLVYFHPKGCLAGFYRAACYDPTHFSDFGTGFWLGNEEILDSFPS